MSAEVTPQEARAVAQRALAKCVGIRPSIETLENEVESLQNRTDDVSRKLDRLEASYEGEQ